MLATVANMEPHSLYASLFGSCTTPTYPSTCPLCACISLPKVRELAQLVHQRFPALAPAPPPEACSVRQLDVDYCLTVCEQRNNWIWNPTT